MIQRKRGRKPNPETGKIEVLQKENRELEQALARITIEKIAIESLMKVAQEHYGEEFRKNFGTGRLMLR